jgi:hypothetical protein
MIGMRARMEVDEICYRAVFASEHRLGGGRQGACLCLSIHERRILAKFQGVRVTPLIGTFRPAS